MSIDMRIDIDTVLCSDMCIGMCIDMCTDMHGDIHAGAVYRHVYEHLSLNVPHECHWSMYTYIHMCMYMPTCLANTRLPSAACTTSPNVTTTTYSENCIFVRLHLCRTAERPADVGLLRGSECPF